jgi:hypothetical protein
MTSRRQFIGSLVALGIFGSPRRAAAAPTGERIALVVAQDSPIRELSRFELKKLYLGARIEDAAGGRIVPFNQAQGSADRVAFEANVLGMAPDEIARYWIDRKIRGESGAPRALSPVDVLQRVVSRLEHSITYVRVSQILPHVRPIAIDGRLPADDAYKLFA